MPLKDKFLQKLIELISFVFQKCSNFFRLNEKENFSSLFNLFLQVLALSDSSQNEYLKSINSYSNFRYEIKNLQLTLLKKISKLSNEVETNLIISHLKRINLGFKVLNEFGFVSYTPSETNLILRALQKGLKINLKSQPIISDTSSDFDQKKIKTEKDTQESLNKIIFQHSKAFNQFIVEYLPTTNFEVEVFQVFQKTFCLLPGELVTMLVEILYNNLIENKSLNPEDNLTDLLLLCLIIEHSQDSVFPIANILEFFLESAIPAFQQSRSHLANREIDILFDYLSTNILLFSFLVSLNDINSLDFLLETISKTSHSNNKSLDFPSRQILDRQLSRQITSHSRLDANN